MADSPQDAMAKPNGDIEPHGAIFLSYPSEDAEAAARICESLRAAGIEVWVDRNELRGGDAPKEIK